jgi:hypothetical protein
VHRSALAPEDPVGASEQLGQGRPQVHAPGKGVGVAPVGGECVVVGSHRSAESGGNRLHAQREVGCALHQVLQEQVVGSLAELPELLELVVHAEADFLVDVGIREQVIDRLG